MLADVKGLPCPLPAAAPRRLQGTDCVPGMPIMPLLGFLSLVQHTVHRWEGRRKGGKLLGRWAGGETQEGFDDGKKRYGYGFYTFVFSSQMLPVAHFGLLTVERSALGATEVCLRFGSLQRKKSGDWQQK